ncbi:MAG: hypothetical protein JSS91_09290 [Bacteroidetes bacterium]|nr:hypothetical protein [Bacteroidota bacterium]
MKSYSFNLSVIYFLLFAFFFVLRSDSFSQNSRDQKNSGESILVTDSRGNILSGDKTDWNYSDKNYNELTGNEDLFKAPHTKKDVAVPEGQQLTYEIIGDKLLLKWSSAKGISFKGFAVEKAEVISGKENLNWTEIGYIKGSKNTNRINRYSYIDKKMKKGKYHYRLKTESTDGSSGYLNLNGEVNWMDYPSTFQFYPVYPNPVNDSFYVRFFVPVKDEVSLFFLKGNDTLYLINNESQTQGFYILRLSKSNFGFSNEVIRLYMVIKSFRKKEYYGDIKFN